MLLRTAELDFLERFLAGPVAVELSSAHYFSGSDPVLQLALAHREVR